MDDKKKKFVIPMIELVEFDRNDVITTSGFKLGNDDADWGTQDGDAW